jgi:hypothetical protein
LFFQHSINILLLVPNSTNHLQYTHIVKKHLFYIVAAAALAGSQFASAQNFVLNGSFETNSNNGRSILNWNNPSSTRATDGLPSIDPQDGSFFVYNNDENPYLNQTLTLNAGNFYNLSFYTASDRYRNSLTVSMGGVALGTVSSFAPSNGWTLNQYTFTATSSSEVLAFAWANNDVLAVDNVSVTAVPEPSTYALFGLGALALVVAYRRKVA